MGLPRSVSMARSRPGSSYLTRKGATSLTDMRSYSLKRGFIFSICSKKSWRTDMWRHSLPRGINH